MKKILMLFLAIFMLCSFTSVARQRQGRLQGGHMGGGDPDTAWVSPNKNAPAIASYQTYPTPARGKGTLGSFMIYLPKEYAKTQKHYPVIYFLHGGNGSQHDAEWLMKKMDKAIEEGKESLPSSWLVFRLCQLVGMSMPMRVQKG